MRWPVAMEVQILMLKIICDHCGADCDLVGYDVLIRSIHNPCPHGYLDTGDMHITDEPKHHIRFTLCQKCYRQVFCLPNLYQCELEQRVVFRGKDITTNLEKLALQ